MLHFVLTEPKEGIQLNAGCLSLLQPSGSIYLHAGCRPLGWGAPASTWHCTAIRIRVLLRAHEPALDHSVDCLRDVGTLARIRVRAHYDLHEGERLKMQCTAQQEEDE